MHAVGVVPEDAEIGSGGLHLGKAADHVVAKGDTRGVGVLGHAPDALDGVVLGHEALDLVHVGALGRHGNGDVLDAEVVGDAEVAVIARSRAEELDRLTRVRGGILRPRRVAAGAAAPEHAGDVVLDEQARRPEHERLVGRATEELARELARRGDALKATVVRAVHAAVEKIGVLTEDREQRARDIDLRGRGFAARHIERKALCADLGDFRLECLDGGAELGVGHLLVDRLHAATFRT